MRQGTLQALTAAALALPGLALPRPCVAQDAVGFQFGQYREGPRDLNGLKSRFDPIESDALSSSAGFTLGNGFSGQVTYRQDTWSGATPIATAPVEMRGNRSRAPDGVSGASPYINSSTTLFLDAKSLEPLRTDGSGNLLGGTDPRIVHTLSGASRETRKQMGLDLTRSWGNATLNFGGGVSQENDYSSWFANIGGSWDFDRKLTRLSAAVSYAMSTTEATLDHDATPYILDSCGVPCGYRSSTSSIELLADGNRVLHGDRRDWGARIGATQVLNKSALIETGLGYLHYEGYLANPYKVVEVVFIDPDQQFLAPPGALAGDVSALLEQRPEVRNLWSFDMRYVQHIDATDAALNLTYRYFGDDWGVRANTIAAEWVQPLGGGWTIAPRARYYTQNAADFYVPYLVTPQARRPKVVDPVRGQVYVDASNPGNGQKYFDDPALANPDGINPITGNPVVDAGGNPVSQSIADSLVNKTTAFDRGKLPRYFSSDHRLSGFGTIGLGLTLTREFARGASFELGYEYYTHQGRLRWGGGGEADFADFRSYMVTASLGIDLDLVSASRGAGQAGEHAGHVRHGGGRAPAGVMFDHMLAGAGEYMVGYRYMGSRLDGSMMRGSRAVGDAELERDGCPGSRCIVAPTEMTMNMHMLDLMYAPNEWLNLMLMLQYPDMSMDMRGLLTDAERASLSPVTNSLYLHHASHEHTSGGIGDSGMFALVRLLDRPGHRVHAAVGVSAPTGSVQVRYRDTHQIVAGYADYGMQLGSGTWDLVPTLTYAGEAGGAYWGAQVGGVKRLEDRNRSGYALGDVFQSTAWVGYNVGGGLSASLRGLYMTQGAVKGEFNGTFYELGPTDFGSNYGGSFADVGVGLNYSVGGGAYRGTQLGIEWLQPLKDDVNGYQLERKGTLYGSFSYAF